MSVHSVSVFLLLDKKNKSNKQLCSFFKTFCFFLRLLLCTDILHLTVQILTGGTLSLTQKVQKRIQSEKAGQQRRTRQQREKTGQSPDGPQERHSDDDCLLSQVKGGSTNALWEVGLCRERKEKASGEKTISNSVKRVPKKLKSSATKQ